MAHRRALASSESPTLGRCHVYVLPCAYEDILKIGFSGNPLARMQALHPRWFEFFDLDRAVLVETETVRDARAVELRLKRSFKLHNAPSPLVVPRRAAGHTEWFRGAYEDCLATVHALQTDGHLARIGLRDWLRNALLHDSAHLYSWAAEVLDRLQLAGDDDTLPAVVCDVLDAYRASGIDLDGRVPDALLQRYRAAR